MVTMVTVLLSVFSTVYFTVCVLEGGRELELAVEWPASLTDLSLLHGNWLYSEGSDGMEKYHPKFFGFEAALNKFRDHNTYKISPMAKISSPLPCTNTYCEQVQFRLKRRLYTYDLL